MKNLGDLKPKETALIRELVGNPETVQRLMSLAILPGESVEVLKVAPLGDPLIIKLRRSQISLRKRDAACVVLVDD